MDDLSLGTRIDGLLHRKLREGCQPEEALMNAINEEMAEYSEDDRLRLWNFLKDSHKRGLISKLHVAIDTWDWTNG